MRWNERGAPVGKRHLDDRIRHPDGYGWAFVYRTQVDENSDPPNRPGVHTLDENAPLGIVVLRDLQQQLGVPCEDRIGVYMLA